jgi:hypothetical protein
MEFQKGCRLIEKYLETLQSLQWLIHFVGKIKGGLVLDIIVSVKNKQCLVFLGGVNVS